MKKIFGRIVDGVADALFGNHCRLCGRPVSRTHPYVCHECWLLLPRMNFGKDDIDAMSQQFITDSGFVRADALFRYNHGSGVAAIVHDIKYHGCENMGRKVGQYAAQEMQEYGIFSGVEAIVPIPVHLFRRMTRGYNQAEVIAHGISDVSGIPVINALYAVRPHKSQTRNSFVSRLTNLRNAFAYNEDTLSGVRHIMIVDDVYTTGATMKSAADLLSAETNVRYSIFTLAAASPL